MSNQSVTDQANDATQAEHTTDAAAREVERALLAHPNIRDAAITLRLDAGEQRLIAYVVPKGVGPSVTQLKTYLQTQVPVNQAPVEFVSLLELPRTSTGQVDRARLHLATSAHTVPGTTYVAPRTDTEAAIAAIWAEALMLDRVGIHDDFLAIGGDSLIATQIVARIWEQFGTEIPLEALFDGGTIAVLVDRFFGETPHPTPHA